MAEDGPSGEQERAGADAAALLLSIGAQEEAREYLKKQSRLADLQIEDAERQNRARHWSLRFGNISAVLKVAFEIAIAFIVVAIAAFVATGMWSAARDKGLVIEAFSVPPDLAQRGLNGEVVASQLLDKLQHMQEQTNSIRPADTYRNNWGDDVKVEIPDTGISIGELNRYLRRWLGAETHITGEIFRTPSGISVATRAQDAGQTFTGKDSDLDSLLQKAAESIYAKTQPYRYASFLNQVGRDQDAMRVLQRLAAVAAPAERAWALSFLGNYYNIYGDPGQSLATLRAGVEADPSNAHAWDNLSSEDLALDHLEDGYRHTQKALSLYDNGAVAFDPDRVAITKVQDRAFLASTVGDYSTAVRLDEDIQQLPDRGGSRNKAVIDEAGLAAQDHDLRLARRLLADLHPSGTDQRINAWFQATAIAYLGGDWRALSQRMERPDIVQTASPSIRPLLERILSRDFNAIYAEAKAEQGDVAGARRLIATTPLDCYTCVTMRGKIEADAKNWGGAAYWFARAVHDGPSIPLALADWGEMLLRKDAYDGAIAKFDAANAIGPHFADPLEMWGEALMGENRSDLALAKFEEANKYAPNWGRLHLEWGRALMYVGHTEEATKQFDIAAHLDLSAAEVATLAQVRAKHG